MNNVNNFFGMTENNIPQFLNLVCPFVNKSALARFSILSKDANKIAFKQIEKIKKFYDILVGLEKDCIYKRNTGFSEPPFDTSYYSVLSNGSYKLNKYTEGERGESKKFDNVDFEVYTKYGKEELIGPAENVSYFQYYILDTMLPVTNSVECKYRVPIEFVSLTVNKEFKEYEDLRYAVKFANNKFSKQEQKTEEEKEISSFQSIFG